MTPEETKTFLSRAAKLSREDGETGCRIWTGNKTTRGYSRIRFGRRARPAHRLAYEAEYGPIPMGLVIDHLCRNPLCINPSHLEAVTNRENVLRGFGPPAINARRTHCKHGHPLSGDNLFFDRGYRRCRICHRRRSAETKKRTRVQGGMATS
jgi:hypothetical protein